MITPELQYHYDNREIVRKRQKEYRDRKLPKPDKYEVAYYHTKAGVKKSDVIREMEFLGIPKEVYGRHLEVNEFGGLLTEYDPAYKSYLLNTILERKVDARIKAKDIKLSGNKVKVNRTIQMLYNIRSNNQYLKDYLR